MTDDSLLGSQPKGLLHVNDPVSRYFGLAHTQTFGKWVTKARFTYGHAQGKGSYGHVRGVKDIQAFGLNIDANYAWNERQSSYFSISQPLRIETGAFQFDRVTGDLTPDGRQIDLTLGYTHKLSDHRSVKAHIRYSKDVEHYDGVHNTGLMLTYSGHF